MSALALVDTTRATIRKFRELEEYPHRYGYLEKERSFAYQGKGCGFVHSYLNTSYANHVVGETSPLARTEFKFRDPVDATKILNGDLASWHKDIFSYPADGIEKSGPFLGSVHLSDFLRRTSGHIIKWWSGKNSSKSTVVFTLNRYSALGALVAVDGVAENFQAKITLNGVVLEYFERIAECSVWTLYKYGFFQEDSELCISVEGDFKYCEILAVELR
ncbi:MAG: hypothetical protein Q8R97_00155 [Brevundimonas sp.]|nr:hypothetical protein [Brevundimonas sp.]